jgi:hypothetical protein
MRRRIGEYCTENRQTEADLDSATRNAIRNKAKANFEEFLSNVVGRKVSLPTAIFDPAPGSTSTEAAAPVSPGEVADDEA